MKVFKFGGASVSTAERILNVSKILESYAGDELLVVISAMGKTTNALEGVVEAFFAGNKDEALNLFQRLREDHVQILIALNEYLEPQKHLQPAILLDFFTEVEWMIHDKPVRSFDYYYDQIVCVGELLSTTIVSSFLNARNIVNTWIDVRDIFRTDNNFRDARIDWTYTEKSVREKVLPLISQSRFVMTQGFIGATDENESTTLGREGSDFSAAVFANLLDAESQTIWKDVKGVMNADPKKYDQARWIEKLNYREVIEMAYYGAQVIHPKTIKPLQNKGIPLYVRSFLDPQQSGTAIESSEIRGLPPIIVHKESQALVELFSKDFSFVGEGLTAEMYKIFETLKFRPNLTQNAAISLLCVVDDQQGKVERLASAAAELFEVAVRKDLRLLTIRHYNESIIKELIDPSLVVMKQQTEETIQVLLK